MHSGFADGHPERERTGGRGQETSTNAGSTQMQLRLTLTSHTGDFPWVVSVKARCNKKSVVDERLRQFAHNSLFQRRVAAVFQLGSHSVNLFECAYRKVLSVFLIFYLSFLHTEYQVPTSTFTNCLTLSIDIYKYFCHLIVGVVARQKVLFSVCGQFKDQQVKVDD